MDDDLTASPFALRSGVTIREAMVEDVPVVVALLAADALGASREDPTDLMPYDAAFARIADDPSEVLVVAEVGGEVVGTLQFSFLPGLSRGGALRAQVGVRVAADLPGTGFGKALLRWAEERAKGEGCALLQLTSDASRSMRTASPSGWVSRPRTPGSSVRSADPGAAQEAHLR